MKIRAVLFFVVVAVIGIGAIVLVRKLTHPVANSAAVVKQIQALNRWETASFTIEKVIDQNSGGNVFQKFLFGSRLLLIAHGTVIAGFDLSTLSENSIRVNNESVTVVLPPPTILITSLDNQKTRVYDRQQGLLATNTNDLEANARLSAENDIRAAACSEGILANASENAKKQLTPVLQSLGFTSVTIQIPNGSC